MWGIEDNSTFQQRGFAFLTSRSLVKAWEEKRNRYGIRRAYLVIPCKRKFDEFAEDYDSWEYLHVCLYSKESHISLR